MVQLLKGSDRRNNVELFDKLSQLRYEVFVARKAWSISSTGKRDVDQYDTDDAIYFYGRSGSGAVCSHVRLNRTAKDSLLADCFPHLVEDNFYPRGQQIYEATRFIVVPIDGRRTTKRLLEAELFSAVVQWCIVNRVTHLQAVLDAVLYSTFIEMAPQSFPLGLVAPYGGGPGVRGGGTAIAVRCPMNSQTLAEVMSYGGLTHVPCTTCLEGFGPLAA